MKFLPDWGEEKKNKENEVIFLEEKCIHITVLFWNDAFPSFFLCLKQDSLKMK